MTIAGAECTEQRLWATTSLFRTGSSGQPLWIERSDGTERTTAGQHNKAGELAPAAKLATQQKNNIITAWLSPDLRTYRCVNALS